MNDYYESLATAKEEDYDKIMNRAQSISDELEKTFMRLIQQLVILLMVLILLSMD